MNRLERIKRALLSVVSGIKNLLYKDYLSTLKGRGSTRTALTNGFSATTTSATGGYGNYAHILLLETPEWGKTYTVTCNIEQSLSGMSSLMRAGWVRTGSYSWNDFKLISVTNSGQHSITFTLPDTPPDTFTNDLENDGYGGGVRLWFNIQLANLGECGTLTVTDIVVNEVE